MMSERAASAGDALPKRLGRYEIISLLGLGGMARVYLGLQRGPAGAAKLLAIKRVRPEVAADEHFVTMFADEARIALRLNHPNVVSTFDVADDSGEFFMVLEYLEGQPLSQILRRIGRANMPLDEHLWLLTQVLTGLHYAHTLHDFDGTPLGIVHRDVSPSNVFVTYTGQVKLVDFGIAKATGAMAETQLGIIKGKLGYAAPEQCLAKPVDARSDVYAVGVMLWEALARRRRAVGETALATVQARIQDTEEPIEQAWPEVPDELASLARHALAVDPAERFASAQDLQRGLEAYAQKHGRRTGQASLTALMIRHFAPELNARRREVEAYIGASRTVATASALRSVASAAPRDEMLTEREPEPDARSFTTTGAVSTLTSGQPRGARLSQRTWLLIAVAATLAALLVLRFASGEHAASVAGAGQPGALAQAGMAATSTPSGSAATTELPPIATTSKPAAKTAASPARARHGAPPSAKSAKGTVVAAGSTPSVAPVETSVFEPGVDLATRAAPSSNKARGIDEKDPYSK